MQPLLLTLDKGYLLTAAPPDLEHGVVPLGPPVPAQPPLPGCGLANMIFMQALCQLTPKSVGSPDSGLLSCVTGPRLCQHLFGSFVSPPWDLRTGGAAASTVALVLLCGL